MPRQGLQTAGQHRLGASFFELPSAVDNTAQQVCSKAEVVPNVSVPWMAHDKSGRLHIKSSRQALLAYRIASACKFTTALDKEHLTTTFETCWAESRDLLRLPQKRLATQVNKLLVLRGRSELQQNGLRN